MRAASVGGLVIQLPFLSFSPCPLFGSGARDAIGDAGAKATAARMRDMRGMPIGSPGMEVEGAEPETYDVIAFGPSGETRYARYKGAEPV
jgi:hypothetical protein